MNKQRPSIFRILQCDYAAFMAVIFPVVMWAIFLFNLYQETNDSKIIYISVVITAIAIPLIIWRIFHFIKFFDIGEETTAVILGVSFYRSRGRADFSYNYKGTDYTSTNLLMNNGRVRKLISGQEIIVLVNPSKPNKAVIRDLFR